MTIEIVDLPINSMVDLSSSLCKRSPEGNNGGFPQPHPLRLSPASMMSVHLDEAGILQDAVCMCVLYNDI